jgi:diguanylate cyclase (GGDEF)-like protein
MPAPPPLRLRVQRPLPRLGLLGSFALLSALPIVVLGIVLARQLGGHVREQAEKGATETAVLVARLGLESQLTRSDVVFGPAPERLARFDRTLAQSGVMGSQVAKLELWNPQRQVVYSSEHDLLATANQIASRRTSDSPELIEALDGRITSRVIDREHPGHFETGPHSPLLRRYGSVLEVYVPLWFGAHQHPAGAFEIYLPYAPVAASLSHDTRRLYAVLGAGLAALYVLLFNIMLRTSRRLERQTRQIREQAERSRFESLHDALTGLPNRLLFHDRAQQALAAASRNGTRAALMIIDLDRFKEINDTLGHANGDALLRQVGPRVQRLLREADTVARLGGDEFGIVVPDIADAGVVRALAARLHEHLCLPVAIDEWTLDLEASIGIAVYPDHGEDVDLLMQRADVAMYVAKTTHAGFELYASERDTYSVERLSLMGDLRRAIDQHELQLHYQPKIDLGSGVVAGVEALVRWQHPQRGMVPPSEFVELAERSGLIGALTMEVVENAVRQARSWADAGYLLPVSVNLSTRDLVDLDLPQRIADVLARHGVEPALLELEITESVIMSDPMRARAVLTRLRAMGVKVAIDDFGTGYSSLGYLKRLPVDTIKIDKSFVLNMTTDESDAAIVRSTVELCRNLGLEVVAEGIEDERACALLRVMGCHTGQGYLFARPMAPSALGEWVRSWRPHGVVGGEAAAG